MCTITVRNDIHLLHGFFFTAVGLLIRVRLVILRLLRWIGIAFILKDSILGAVKGTQ